MESILIESRVEKCDAATGEMKWVYSRDEGKRGERGQGAHSSMIASPAGDREEGKNAKAR